MAAIITAAFILAFVIIVIDTLANKAVARNERKRQSKEAEDIESYDNCLASLIADNPVKPYARASGTTPWSKLGNYHYSYETYIASDEWKELAKGIKARDNYKCKQCGSGKNLNVHHLTYTNLYNEPPSDLVTVCRDCHQAIHDHHKEAPYNLLPQ